jgi:glycosyltransferase involved in cell wall biosynthesis
MSKLSVLMTVYNEADFIDYSIRSCLPYIDELVIVEGAYKETIAIGGSKRSTDKTLEICQKYIDEKKVHIIEANEQTDKDQRNVGLNKIKETNQDGWFMIVDGDEVYDSNTFHMIKTAIKNMERTNKYAAYFKSLTFVNDMQHFTEQEFPRLFKITPGCEFVNDNFLEWKDKNLKWSTPHVIKIPYIRYFHFSFCKGSERFKLKRDWWMNRGLGAGFEYGWRLNNQEKIEDPNHEIYEYTGQYPDVIKDHPGLKKDETT